MSAEAARDRFSRTWTYNGQLIRAGQRRMEIGPDGSLFIRQVGPANVGSYQCSVTSPFGTQSEAARLTIIGKAALSLSA